MNVNETEMLVYEKCLCSYSLFLVDDSLCISSYSLDKAVTLVCCVSEKETRNDHGESPQQVHILQG